jgi:8-oxo-dGTP diphosphatase
LRHIRLGQNVPMTISADDTGRVRIVTAILRDGDRVLLCHRSAGRRWYPNVWDLPGGHVEEGEDPKASIVRELREELGIIASEPSGPPLREIWSATFDMQIWLIDGWEGSTPNRTSTTLWRGSSGPIWTACASPTSRISQCSPLCLSCDAAIGYSAEDVVPLFRPDLGGPASLRPVFVGGASYNCSHE